MPHPFSYRHISASLPECLPRKTHAGIAFSQASVRAGVSFAVSLPHGVSVNCNYDINLFSGLDKLTDQVMHDSRLHSASIWIGIPSTYHDFDSVDLWLAEWAERDGAAVDPDIITQEMAATGKAGVGRFPCDLNSVIKTGGLPAINDTTVEAIDWLLDRMENGTARIDPSRARILAGSEVYDGTGRLLAFQMRLRPDQLANFARENGEPALKEAFRGGHLQSGGPTSMTDKLVEMKLDKIMGRKSGAVTWPTVRHDVDAYGRVIAPHLDNTPFGAPPAEIGGVVPAVLMLESAIGIERPATAPGPA